MNLIRTWSKKRRNIVVRIFMIGDKTERRQNSEDIEQDRDANIFLNETNWRRNHYTLCISDVHKYTVTRVSSTF